MTLLIILMGIGLFASNVIGVVICYVLGYRVGMKQNTPLANPNDIHAKCICTHWTTSHKRLEDGTFGACTANLCACKGHISNTSSTLVRSAYQL